GVDEAGGAVAALEAVVLQELLLDGRQVDRLALGIAAAVRFDGAHLLALEEQRAGDTGADLLAGAVGLVEDHDAGMADALAAAQPRTGQVQVFVQEIDHHQVRRHLQRADGLAVDRQAEGFGGDAHARASCICAAVTGNVVKRCPMAWAMPLTMAPTIGIMTTSAMPLGGSVSDSGGRISAVWVQRATSLASGK